MEPRTSCLSETIWISSWVLIVLMQPMLNFILLRHPYEHPELYTPYYGPFFYWSIMVYYVLETAHFIAAYVTNPGRSYNHFVSTTQLPSDNEKCDRCEIKRVERSHHCSACAQCSMRMDHHCVWINNCMGVRNYKFFMVFLTFAPVRCS